MAPTLMLHGAILIFSVLTLVIIIKISELLNKGWSIFWMALAFLSSIVIRVFVILSVFGICSPMLAHNLGIFFNVFALAGFWTLYQGLKNIGRK